MSLGLMACSAAAPVATSTPPILTATAPAMTQPQATASIAPSVAPLATAIATTASAPSTRTPVPATAQASASATAIKPSIVEASYKNIPAGITSDGFYFLGHANAPVTLTDYSDFL
ncbi:MAG: hypothetical protein KIH69_018260 [Anaerolineae bacterium]|nr:hypothetical protein [Anaerolineae bacterium]